ncbi:MAG: MFS transporter, partial [Halodesulfurarchaeum sp.]
MLRGRLAGVVFAVLFAQVLLYPGIDLLVGAYGATGGLEPGMWFLAAEFAGFVAFAPVWGVASDRAGRRRPFIVAGALGGALGYVVLALAVGTLPFAVVVGLRVLQGGATIGAFSLAISALMDLGGGHGRNMGAAGVAIGGGTSLGAPVGGQLYELGVTAPLWAAATLLAVVAGVTAAGTERAPTPTGARSP